MSKLACIIGRGVSMLPKKLLRHIEKTVFMGQIARYPATGAVDICFVPGGSMTRIHKALELYEEGKVKTFLLSGGIGPLSLDRETPEAEIFRQFLVKRGVPKERILVENRSRNTIENIDFSVELLKSLGYDLEKTSFLVVTNDYHMRRTLGLLQRKLGAHKTLYYETTRGEKASEAVWRNSDFGRFIVAKEYFRLREKNLA